MRKYGLGVVDERSRPELVGQVRERTTHIRRQDVKKLRHLGRKAFDPPLAVEKQRRHIGGRKEVLQVAGQPRKLFDLVLVFLIERDQLLVNRLQLLLAGLELLSRRAQFLVDRAQLLVRRLHRLARRFVLFDDALEPPPGALRLLLELPDGPVIVGARRFGGRGERFVLVEDQQRYALFGVRRRARAQGEAARAAGRRDEASGASSAPPPRFGKPRRAAPGVRREGAAPRV